MIACPRCGRVDDGTSYQCPDCFTVLQPDLATERKRPPRAAPAGPPPGAAPPPGAGPPPGAAPPQGPTPDNPYRPPGAPPQPPAPYGGYGSGNRPMGVPDVPTYLVHSILATLLCCLPFGIVAIVYAAKVGTMQAVGDYHAATRASDSARMWCWISFGCGLVGTILYLIIMFSVVQQPRHY